MLAEILFGITKTDRMKIQLNSVKRFTNTILIDCPYSVPRDWSPETPSLAPGVAVLLPWDLWHLQPHSPPRAVSSSTWRHGCTYVPCCSTSCKPGKRLCVMYPIYHLILDHWERIPGRRVEMPLWLNLDNSLLSNKNNACYHPQVKIIMLSLSRSCFW